MALFPEERYIMYHFTVPMALMDFVPVIFFGITAVLLIQDLSNKMNKAVFTLFAAGCFDVFLAGFCKAMWKLLYAANVCNFVFRQYGAYSCGRCRHQCRDQRRYHLCFVCRCTF